MTDVTNDSTTDTGEDAGSTTESVTSNNTNKSSDTLAPNKSSNQKITGSNATNDNGTGADGETSSPEDTKPQGAPEKYDFKVPEGMTVDDKIVQQFEPIAREHNLSNEAVQALVDFEAARVKSAGEAQAADLKTERELWAKEQQKWITDLKADPDFGGAKHNEAVQASHKAIGAFADKDFVEWAKETGMGNFPPLVKLLSRIGRAMGEDKVHNGDPTVGKKTAAEVMYPAYVKAEA